MTREFLIWSIEHEAWWRPGEMGHTRVLHEAGRYPEIRARAILHQANIVTCNACLIPAECVAVEPVRCSSCHKGVSGFDPELGLVVRAFVECPECIERRAAESAPEGASER